MAEQKDKCAGCQSFCMRGAQVVGQAPGTSTDKNYSSDGETKNTYPKTWEQWQKLSATVTTIQSSSGLTAQSQKDLADFIKMGYEEGTYSVIASNFLTDEYQTKQIKRLEGVSPETPSYNFSGDYTSAISEVGSGNIIKASHYNSFRSPLNFNKTGSINFTVGDKTISLSYNGPVVGFNSGNSSGNLPLVVGMDSVSDKTLATTITAKQYIDLANQASKLLYHPFQCNICNIYEGSEWLEVVKETFGAIAAQAPPYHEPKGKASYITLTSNGVEMHMRADCSGAVAACLRAYNPDVIPAGAPGSWTTHGMGEGGEYGSYISQAGFNWFNGDGPWEAGDIQLSIEHHVQVVNEDVTGAYSGGSTSGLAGTPSGLTRKGGYDGGWRVSGLGSAGGCGSGQSAGDAPSCTFKDGLGDIGENEDSGGSEGGGNSGGGGSNSGGGGNSGGNGGNSGGCTNGESCYTSCQAIQGTISPCQAVCQIYNSPYDTDCDSRQLDACGQR